MNEKVILKYLNIPYKNATQDLLKDINDILVDVKNEIIPHNVYKIIDINQNHNIDLSHPNIKTYLRDANKIMFLAITLGSTSIRMLTRYNSLDKGKLIMLNKTLDAYIEYLADRLVLEKLINPSYRFAPGYQNTNLDINKQIATYLNAEKLLGIEFLQSNMMLPEKTMINIIANNNTKNNCRNCLLNSDCSFHYREEKCYEIN